MAAVKLDEPLSILVLLGLTLPEVSEGDLAKIRAAAPGSSIKVAPRVGDAIAMADDVEVILGFLPESLFQAAPRLRWVHAIASGVDMFLYPAMRDSDVVLTGEKGLVGGHLADTGFGCSWRSPARLRPPSASARPVGRNVRPCAVKRSSLRG